MCFQQCVLQRPMILMRLPPAGLEKVESLFRPLVVLAPKVTPRGTALEFSILFPHSMIHAVAVQVQIQKAADDRGLLCRVKHLSPFNPQTRSIVAWRL